MNDRLEKALRDCARDFTLRTPAADVLDRGDRYRRQRRSLIALGASGVVAATAFGVAALGAQPDQPDPSERAPVGLQVASWTGPTTNLSATQLTEVEAACAASVEGQGLTEPGWDLPGSVRPTAAELRDDLVLTYFRRGQDYATCQLETTKGGGFEVTGQSAGRAKAVPAGRHVATVTAGASDPGPRGQTLSDVYFVIRTSPQVATLELTVAGTIYASTADGIALFWLPDGVLTQAGLDRATVTALDADGEVLYRSRPGQDW